MVSGEAGWLTSGSSRHAIEAPIVAGSGFVAFGVVGGGTAKPACG